MTHERPEGLVTAQSEPWTAGGRGLGVGSPGAERGGCDGGVVGKCGIKRNGWELKLNDEGF